MAEVVEAGNVEVVNLADVPYLALWAGGPMRLALGLLFGLLLGGSGAFLLERMNTSIRRPEELDRMVPVPGLAVIPMIQQAGPRQPRLAGLLRRGRNGSDGAAGSPGGFGTLPQPLSIGTEAFRMLRTSLVWSESGETLRTIVVTSAAPGEGKTITAANLAVIFAHEGRRVLLIDSDVRRPKLHTMLRVPRSPGLVDLLRSHSDMEELATRTQALQQGVVPTEVPAPDYIRSTSIRGLYLLPCGRIEPTMADLSSAARIRRLLGDLGKWFDVVILDTPPVLAVADAGILGAMADGVLLVVRAGQTDRTAVLRAHQHLAQIGARVVGTVFNDPEGEVTGEGGYYYPYDYAVQTE
jgi:succinoglycan biosynthesis transport protein ExoP